MKHSPKGNICLDAPESYSSVVGFGCPCSARTGDHPAAAAAASATSVLDASVGMGTSFIATHTSVSSCSSSARAASSFALFPHHSPCPSLLLPFTQHSDL